MTRSHMFVFSLMIERYYHRLTKSANMPLKTAIITDKILLLHQNVLGSYCHY